VGMIDIAEKISACLTEHYLVRTERGDYDWVFHFTDDAFLRVACPWRIVQSGGIALGDCDDAQKFGLPEPVDAARTSEQIFLNRAITAVKLRDDTGDIAIHFGDRAYLEVLNTSSGYEGWQFGATNGLMVVATGGGELALWEN
jgi:hypothetical protein